MNKPDSRHRQIRPCMPETCIVNLAFFHSIKFRRFTVEETSATQCVYNMPAYQQTGLSEQI